MKLVMKVVGAVVVLAALALAAPLWMYFPGHNFRVVEAGAFYGSRQMGARALEAAIKKYNVRTVLNLRGPNAGAGWYDSEVAVCQRLGVAHEDFAWSKGHVPDPESLRRFVQALETGKRPMLAHCEGGTHRTAVAAACYLLLKGADVATARKQFGVMFKDAPIGQLLTLYAPEASMPFGQWARDRYPALYK